MKFTKTTVQTAIGAAGIAAASVFAAPIASAAPPNMQEFGTSESLIDGPMVTAYTVSNLRPSSIAIPGYTPKGTLYQADITAKSDGGTVTPIVRDFSARGPSGQTYKPIEVAAPNGLNPAPIPQGSESRGTLYFDVTGARPMGVLYNDDQLQELLIWTSNVRGA